MYNYQEQKKFVFTEEGQRVFLKIRDKVVDTIKAAGCIRLDKAISENCGDVWDLMACVDRLVELKEIVEVINGDYAGQYRIFTKFD